MFKPLSFVSSVPVQDLLRELLVPQDVGYFSILLEHLATEKSRSDELCRKRQ